MEDAERQSYKILPAVCAAGFDLNHIDTGTAVGIGAGCVGDVLSKKESQTQPASLYSLNTDLYLLTRLLDIFR